MAQKVISKKFTQHTFLASSFFLPFNHPLISQSLAVPSMSLEETTAPLFMLFPIPEMSFSFN